MILSCALVACNGQNVENKIKEYGSQIEIFEKKVNKIENDSLKKKMKEAEMLLFSSEMTKLEMQKVPETEYMSDPYSVINNYSSLESLTENYINGVIPVIRSDNDKELSVQIRNAFTYPFRMTTKWEQTFFEDGKIFSILKESSQNRAPKSDSIKITESNEWTSPKSIEVHYPDKGQKTMPVQMQASFYAEMPSNITKFHFYKKNIGTIQKVGNISIKLISMQNSFAEIEVSTPNGFNMGSDICDQYNWLKIAAKDSKGHFLSESGGSTSLAIDMLSFNDLYQKAIKQEAFTSEFLSNFLADFNKRTEEQKLKYKNSNKNKYFRFSRFRGIVEEVCINVYDYTNSIKIKKDIKFPIVHISGSYSSSFCPKTFPRVQTTASIYDNEVKEMLDNKYELSEDNLNTEIRISQEPSTMTDYAVIIFQYPQLTSSKFFQNRFAKLKTVTFYDKNKRPIEISPDSINLNLDLNAKKNLLVNFEGNGIEYHPERFHVVPYFAKGTALVNLFGIERQIWAVDHLPEGIRLEGNALIIDHSVFGDYEFYVMDNTKQYLKLIDKSLISGRFFNKNSTYFEVYYFYGKPQIVELYKIASQKQAEYHFDVKLTRKVFDKYAMFYK